MAERLRRPVDRFRWVLRLGRACLLAAPLTALPWLGPAPAQTSPASLVADAVAYDPDTEQLTARGRVEVFFEGRVLRAEAIVYDARAEQIRAAGPITLTDPGGAVLLADAASLSPDLRNGLIEGARLLIAGQLQLAAAEARRSDGRFTTLYNTVASSCVVCAENPTPTWAVRAARITQDEARQRLYFENATVELFGVPVAYAPRLSLPDPQVRRASGLLLPDFRSSEIYGFGFKLPYYQVLGPHADATITPFVTSSGALLLEGEYRRRLARGGYDLSGVLAVEDGFEDDAWRGWFSGVGETRLGNGMQADFDVNVTSDDSFLQQFDYSDTDLLTSTARLRRSRADEYLELGAIAFQSLREEEDAGTVPLILPEFIYRRTFRPDPDLGRFGVDLAALGVTREVGRDVLRAGGGGDWRGDWTSANGLLVAATARADVDVYQTRNDPGGADGARARMVPTAALDLRWPVMRSGGRAAHVIEPVIQVAYSEVIGAADVPNEDSQLPEFDETNLFSLNRFPGRDRYETGLRANVGISYTRHDPAGWSAGLTLGRVLRAERLDDFAAGTGLDGPRSDFVSALSVDFDWGLTLANRALFDDKLIFRRNEFALGYEGQFGAVSAAYVFLDDDDSNPVLGDQPETDEFAIDARYRFLRNWQVRGLWRYDAARGSNLRTGAGITYGNECAEFDLSVSRRFTSSANVPPSTTVQFGLRLAGLGSGRQWDWPARVCTTRGT